MNAVSNMPLRINQSSLIIHTTPGLPCSDLIHGSVVLNSLKQESFEVIKDLIAAHGITPRASALAGRFSAAPAVWDAARQIR